jgi:hypothetical protein
MASQPRYGREGNKSSCSPLALSIVPSSLTVTEVKLAEILPPKTALLAFIKSFRATSHVRWLNGEKTNVSRTICLQYPEDVDRGGPRNFGFFAI